MSCLEKLILPWCDVLTNWNGSGRGNLIEVDHVSCRYPTLYITSQFKRGYHEYQFIAEPCPLCWDTSPPSLPQTPILKDIGIAQSSTIPGPRLGIDP